MRATIILQGISLIWALHLQKHRPIEIVEETKKVKTQFEKGLFLVTAQSPEDFSSVIHMSLLSDPVKQV